MECLLPYSSMVTVPHIMVGLERMLDYRGVGLERFHCTRKTGIGNWNFICITSRMYAYKLCATTSVCVHRLVDQ